MGGLGILNFNLSNYNINNTTGTFANLAPNNYTVTVTDVNGCSISSTTLLTQPPPFILDSVTYSNAWCTPNNNGSIVAYVNGGIPNYTITATSIGGIFTAAGTSVNNLITNIYTVTIKDLNNCTVSSIVNVGAVTPILVTSISTTPILCNGAFSTLSTLGNFLNPNTIFALAPAGISNTTGTFTGLTADVYTLSITDAYGCTYSSINNITQPNLVTINAINATPTLCNGINNGTISTSAIGGTGTITYTNINSGNNNTIGLFTGLGAATYTIAVADANGCSSTSTATVAQPSSLSWNAILLTDVSCFGGTNGNINISAIGGSGTITYTKNGVISFAPFNNLTAGNYTLTAADVNGCSISTLVNITQPAIMQVDSITTAPVQCLPNNSGVIAWHISGGNNIYTYTVNNGTPSASNTFYNLIAGVYNVTVTDSKGCSINTNTVLATPANPSITSITKTSTGCIPNNIGTATINAIAGSSVLNTYSITANAIQASNVFTNLVMGNYTATVTDIYGCTSSATFIISVSANPIVSNIVSTPQSCVPGCDGLLNVIAISGTSPYTYTINNNATQTLNIFSNLCSNNYSITVTDANGCTSTSNIAVGIRPSPVVSNIVSNNITCNGYNNGSITYTATGGTPTYTFTLNNTSASATGNFTNLIPSNYTIGIVDYYGCIDSGSVTISQPASITFTNLNGISPLCFNGTNGSITANASGGTGAIQYSINNGSLQGSPTFNNLNGNATYVIVATDGNGCNLSTTFFINQPPAIVITSLLADSSTCWSLTNGGITGTASGGTGAIGYSIFPTNASNSTGIFSNLFSSIYTFTVTDGNGCTTAQSTIVQQPPILNLITSNNINVACFGNTNGSFSVTPIGGVGGYTITLLNNNTINNTGLFNNLAAGVYTTQVTDAGGCTRTTTTNITQPAVLQYNTINKQNINCYGTNNGNIGVNTAGGNGTNVFAISPSVLPNNSNGIFTPLNAGTYTITTIDVLGCSISTAVSITQPDSLLLTLVNKTNPSCNGTANGSITTSATGGSPNYNYNLMPGSINNGTGIFTNITGGNYTITVTDINSCSKTIVVSISNPVPIVIDSITTTNAKCFGDSNGSLQVTTVGGVGSLTYSLQPGNYTSSNGVFNNLAANSYTITVADVVGCSSGTFINVLQNPKINFTNIQLVNPRCAGGTEGEITFSAAGGIAPITFAFNNGNFNSNTFYNNLTLGSYTIVAKDNFGCTISTIATLASPQPLLVNIDSFYNEICPGNGNAEVYVSAVFGNIGEYSYIMQPNNYINSNGTFTNIPPGDYTITVIDSKGCTGTTAVTLNLNYDTMRLRIDVTPISCAGYARDGAIDVSVTKGYPPYTYLWLPNLDSTRKIDSLVYGIYQLTVKDAKGCIIKDSILMPPSNCCEVFIPNVFTPNKDGVNDELIPKTSASQTLLRYDVFDRFGNKVYGTTVFGNGWDGTFKGLPLDMDTYFYIYQYKCLSNNEVYLLKGDVILSR